MSELSNKLRRLAKSWLDSTDTLDPFDSLRIRAEIRAEAYQDCADELESSDKARFGSVDFVLIANKIRILALGCKNKDAFSCEFGNEFAPKAAGYLKECFPPNDSNQSEARSDDRF